MPEYLTEGCKTKLVPIVSSGRAARLIAKVWKEKYNYLPDAFVVEGPMAGGHLGFKAENLTDPNYALENLVTDVLAEARQLETDYAKKIPVIAGGGIFTGEDIYNIMKLGADGVQMGTRFVATDECDASELFKQAFVDEAVMMTAGSLLIPFALLHGLIAMVMKKPIISFAASHPVS